MYYNNIFKANNIKGLLNNGKHIEESTSHEQSFFGTSVPLASRDLITTNAVLVNAANSAFSYDCL